MLKCWTCNFRVCLCDRSVFNVQFKCMPRANRHTSKEGEDFSIFVLFLFISNHVNHTCSYQEKCHGEKFYVGPKLDLEY